MRRNIIAGNWKMNKTYEEAVNFVQNLKNKDLSGVTKEIQIFVPSLYLKELVDLTEGTKIQIGAENIHQENSGAYTGEISAEMLKSIGVKYTLIGHSERREYFNETDEMVNKKVKIALKNDINPVVCVGETLEEKNINSTNKVLKTQIEKGLAGIDAKDMKNIVIAYEPVWAIGTGKTATSEMANEACAYIRSVISGLYGEAVANETIIEYGGSVKPDNVAEILAEENIDGVLVGGASLEIDSYLELLK